MSWNSLILIYALEINIFKCLGGGGGVQVMPRHPARLDAGSLQYFIVGELPVHMG